MCINKPYIALCIVGNVKLHVKGFILLYLLTAKVHKILQWLATRIVSFIQKQRFLIENWLDISTYGHQLVKLNHLPALARFSNSVSFLKMSSIRLSGMYRYIVPSHFTCISQRLSIRAMYGRRHPEAVRMLISALILYL